MRKDYTYLNDKINELYKVYENFAWKSDLRKLVVVFQEECTLSFYLYNKYYLIDELNLEFEKQEYPLYHYLSLNLFIKMLGNVKIHKFTENVYYNPNRKPYLLVAAKNKAIKDELDSLITLQETTNITPSLKVVTDLKKSIKHKYIDDTFLTKLDERIELSDKMLRRYH